MTLQKGIMTITVNNEQLLKIIAQLRADYEAGNLTAEEVFQELQRLHDNLMDYINITCG